MFFFISFCNINSLAIIILYHSVNLYYFFGNDYNLISPLHYIFCSYIAPRSTLNFVKIVNSVDFVQFHLPIQWIATFDCISKTQYMCGTCYKIGHYKFITLNMAYCTYAILNLCSILYGQYCIDLHNCQMKFLCQCIVSYNFKSHLHCFCQTSVIQPALCCVPYIIFAVHTVLC